MLLATCRPLHAEPAGHSLKGLIPDLLVHRLSREIALIPLSEAEVEEYLAVQPPAGHPPPGLSALVHRHSEGNPLFMVAALEHMAKRSLLTRVDGRWELRVPLEQIEFEVPEDLRHMIEAQLEPLLAQEQSALELASIAGVAFAASVISALAPIDSHNVEDLYAELSRRHHIVKWAGTQSLPDGSMTERYEFVHALYRQVLYDRQLPGRRARLHRQIGERLAALYAQRMEEVVPELAYHFEQAADWPRAIDYLQQAAQIAGRRYAHRQADALLARALELVSHLSGAQRTQAEPQLLEALAAHRAAAFDMRAIETYETLAARPGSRAARAAIECRAGPGHAYTHARDLRVPTFVGEWLEYSGCTRVPDRTRGASQGAGLRCPRLRSAGRQPHSTGFHGRPGDLPVGTGAVARSGTSRRSSATAAQGVDLRRLSVGCHGRL
jgi:predicted ATPase